MIRYNRTHNLVRSILIIRSNCSCATSNLCFDKAKLYISDNHILNIQGFQIGCTPLDSILSSTLECFYKQSCINYLIDTFKISLDTTIETLVKNLFIGKWNSYRQLFELLCTDSSKSMLYSYIKRNHLLSVIIEILGIYGGLTAAFCFILLTVFRFLVKIKQ